MDCRNKNNIAVTDYLLIAFGVVVFCFFGYPFVNGNIWPQENGFTKFIISNDSDSIQLLVFPRVIDLPITFQGAKVTGTIEFRNCCMCPIENIEIKAGCSCSVAKSERNFLHPGEATNVDFSINTSGKLGLFSSKFLVQYTVSQEKYVDSFITNTKIQIPGKLSAHPSLLAFKDECGMDITRNISILIEESDPDTEIETQKILAPSWVSYNISEQNGNWTLTLCGKLPSHVGRRLETIIVKTNSDKFPELLIPLIIEECSHNKDVVAQ